MFVWRADAILAELTLHLPEHVEHLTKAVEKMAHQQGFKNLKFKNRHGVIFHDADWIAGVGCEENEDEQDEENDEECEQEEDKDDEEFKADEEIDPNEVDNVVKESKDEHNPNEHQEAEGNEEPQQPEQQDGR